MTTPTNDRQTSERERLTVCLDDTAGIKSLPRWLRTECEKAADQLRAADAEIEALQASVAELRGPLMRRAADEIERLRAEVAENDGVIAVWRRRCQDAERELAALREENTKLRTDMEQGFMAGAYARLQHLQKAERDLAALRERIEKAPEGFVNYGLVYDEGAWFTYAPEELEGKIVRLVEEL